LALHGRWDRLALPKQGLLIATHNNVCISSMKNESNFLSNKLVFICATNVFFETSKSTNQNIYTMKWNDEDEKDTRVKETTEWYMFEFFSQFMKETSGVYVFADGEKEVVYIGKAGGTRMIVEGEDISEIKNAMYRLKHRGATHVKALYTEDGDIALDLEGDLIKKYNPVNNGINLLKS
jgi:hypothetical protein